MSHDELIITVDTEEVELTVEDVPDVDVILDKTPDVILLASGNMGPQGPQGTQGEIGPVGPEGDQGPVGPEGPQGIEGPMGPTGPQGSTGTGITMKGSVPTSGDLPTTGQEQGDAYIVEADDSLWIYDGSNWTSGGSIQGPPGPTGPQGSQGPTGAQGPQGAKGDTGTPGEDGLGVPPGGTTGEILTKLSNADNDSDWLPPAPSGADLNYLGDYVPATPYDDGDIVMYNGMPWMAVKPTTTPPDPWPGSTVEESLPDRLQDPLVVWSGTDWNNLLEAGWWHVTPGKTNCPPDDSEYYVQIFRNDTNFALQIARNLWADQKYTWRRYRNEGTWTSWVRNDDVPPIQDSYEDVGKVLTFSGDFLYWEDIESGLPDRLNWGEEITDWDNVQKPGWFHGFPGLHAPPGFGQYDIVVGRCESAMYGSWKRQTVWNGNASAGSPSPMWERRGVENTWEPWRLVGGGAELTYEGDHVPATTYQDGDIVVKDGIAYICVGGPTTTAPDITPWGQAALVTTGYGTSFPASPVNGQEHILVDSLTNPTYQWRFRYNANSSSAYKWEFIGGNPIISEVITQETQPSGTYSAITTPGPMITLPRPGDYLVELSCVSSGAAGGPDRMSYDIGATAAVDADAAMVQRVANTFGYTKRSRIKTGLPAVTLTAKYRGTGSASFQDRQMQVTPVRVS